MDRRKEGRLRRGREKSIRGGRRGVEGETWRNKDEEEEEAEDWNL